MTTTIQLTLANAEVNRLFTRKLKKDVFFYEAVMQKIGALLKRCQAEQAYALLALHHIQTAIHQLTNAFYDDIDQFEGLIEKKKHLRGKTFTFTPLFHPEVSFNSSVAADLVELFEVYDRLISTLKVLRVAGCFANDDDYFNNLRRYFKTINRLLSQIKLTSLHNIPEVSFTDVIDCSESYQMIVSQRGEVDYSLLYEAMSSNLAPRLEKIRQSLLSRLTHKLNRSHAPDPLQENLQCA